MAFTLYKQGKATDTYKSPDHPDIRLLVPSNRISAFDVPMNDLIPSKGLVITHMTVFWATKALAAAVCPTHLCRPDDPFWVPEGAEEFAGRAIAVWDAEMLLVECIVRGNITGSAWREYKKEGTMHGSPLPPGMLEGDFFPEPVFTPSTKSDEHDVNISFGAAVAQAERQFPGTGGEVMELARSYSLGHFKAGNEEAAKHGIIILDTKYEFGFVNGKMVLCDEILTPDSSRCTPAEGFEPGSTPVSLDKEKLRQYLISIGMDGKKPPPDLPEWLTTEISTDYLDICEQLTGSRPALAA